MKELSRKGVPAASPPLLRCACLLSPASPRATRAGHGATSTLPRLPASPGGCSQRKQVFFTIFVTILPDAGHTSLKEIKNKVRIFLYKSDDYFFCLF